VPAFADRSSDHKLDRALRHRAETRTGTSRVIIETSDARLTHNVVKALGGKTGRRLKVLHAVMAEVPDAALAALAAHRAVRAVSLDRPIWPTMERTSATIGAPWVRQNYGLDGSGVGVAVIDSGVSSWHDDLSYSYDFLGGWAFGQRVTHFADFVNYAPSAYDDYGHGTHVAGIIGGNGADSDAARTGVAPKADIVALKVLDGQGHGFISNVMAAIDYAIAYKDYFNIRVINLSVAAAVDESYTTDPLTQAAKRAVEAGIVVVAAAGNVGRTQSGAPVYGGITAPGNAPWVLTVGGSSHNGTPERSDDLMAAFSSRGPSRFDYAAKPDIVAPGVGVESLSEPGSYLFLMRPDMLLWGKAATTLPPYLSLTGTSMSAPVVSGTIALMLQANPALTPNAVKAILQYTAERRDGYNALTQGGGFLNARGAVDLARAFSGQMLDPVDDSLWSKQLIWGNHQLSGGALQAGANAWAVNVVWGTSYTPEGDNVVWGTQCPAGDPGCDNVVWGTLGADNVVWGTTACDPADPSCDNVVWGTTDDDNVVWGTECGGENCDNVVWGTLCDAPNCDNVVWGTLHPGDNVVWGTFGDDNVVWGTLDSDNVVWSTTDTSATSTADTSATSTTDASATTTTDTSSTSTTDTSATSTTDTSSTSTTDTSATSTTDTSSTSTTDTSSATTTDASAEVIPPAESS
jgi:subtilisin family serine protease